MSAATNNITTTATANTIAATPKGPGADLDALPHGIKTIISYNYAFNLWWLVLLIVILLLLGILFWWFKYYLPRKKSPTPPDPLETIKQEVTAMAINKPFDSKSQAEFFFHLSMKLRQYIELTTKIPATDRTFNELIKPIRRDLPLSYTQVTNILQFLEHAELVKFAGMFASSAEALKKRDDVLKWFTLCKPLLHTHLSDEKSSLQASHHHKALISSVNKNQRGQQQ